MNACVIISWMPWMDSLMFLALFRFLFTVAASLERASRNHWCTVKESRLCSLFLQPQCIVFSGFMMRPMSDREVDLLCQGAGDCAWLRVAACPTAAPPGCIASLPGGGGSEHTTTTTEQ